MDAQPPPAHERELLLLAVGVADEPAVRPRIEHLLAEGIDWAALVRSAMDHRLVPLLDARLRPVAAPLVPRDITQALGVWSERSLQRARALEESVAEIAAALQERCIDGLFVRGPTVAQMIYRDLRLREASNPRVLLRHQDLDAFDGLLRARGFEARQSPQSMPTPLSPAPTVPTQTYVRGADEVVFEAQTAILAASCGMALDLEGMRQRAVDLDVGGTPVRTPAAEDLATLLCVTGGLREWAVVGGLCDLAWLLRSHPTIDIAALRARARAQGAERLLLLGLGLAQHVLGAAVDPAITGDRRTRRMLAGFSACLLADRARQPRSARISARQLQLRDRWTDRSRYIARTLLAACRDGLARRERQTDPQPAIAATERNKVHWGRRSDAWQKWSELTRPRSVEFSRALIAAAGVESGHHVLDLACGVGDTSLELSPLVGTDGLVITTDLAFDMVGRARRRAAADGLANLQFAAASMDGLPFADTCLDGIVCRLGIMYCPRVPLALAEARRVLKPGARAAFLVCGPRADNPILKIVHDVVTELFELEAPDGVIDPFRFAAPGSLAKAMAQAGFLEVSEEDVVLCQRPPARTRFWQASLERGLSLPLEDLPGDTRQALERRMAAAFEPFLKDGRYELPGLSRITYGTCPA